MGPCVPRTFPPARLGTRRCGWSGMVRGAQALRHNRQSRAATRAIPHVVPKDNARGG